MAFGPVAAVGGCSAMIVAAMIASLVLMLWIVRRLEKA
jgi:hypothetical protein